MTYKVIRGQGQGEEMTSVPYRDYFLWMLHVAVAQSFLSGIEICYVFLVLWLSLCFHIMALWHVIYFWATIKHDKHNSQDFNQILWVVHRVWSLLSMISLFFLCDIEQFVSTSRRRSRRKHISLLLNEAKWSYSFSARRKSVRLFLAYDSHCASLFCGPVFVAVHLFFQISKTHRYDFWTYMSKSY